MSGACLGDADQLDEGAAPEVQTTVCGHDTRVGLDGEPVTTPIAYRFAVLDADLAARPEVAAQLGYDRVTSCQQARAASLALLGDEPVAADAAAGGGVEAKVMGGDVVASKRGVVKLSMGCTGTMVNPRVVLTAAHCLVGFIATGDSGVGSIRVQYFDPDVGGVADVTNGSENLNVFIHPNWSGNDDPEDDLGIIVRGTTWNNTTSADYQRIFDDHFGKVGTIRIYGAGYNNVDGSGLGVLRTTTFNIDWYNSWYSITLAAATRRVCQGDSGAPVFKEVDGLDLLAGVHSQSDKNTGEHCAKNRGNQRHTRMHPTKIAWLENTAGVTCNPFTTSGIQYQRCF